MEGQEDGAREAPRMTTMALRKVGRPPLFGKAGGYKRAYAELDQGIARRLRDDARARSVSVSRLVNEICGARERGRDLSSHRFRGGDRRAGRRRVWAQLDPSMARDLSMEAKAVGWGLPGLLAALIEESYQKAGKATG